MLLSLAAEIGMDMSILHRQRLEKEQSAIAMPNATSVPADPGAQLTCFHGTKVQILTPDDLQGAATRLFQVNGARVHEWLTFQERVAGVAQQRRGYSAVAGTACLLFVVRLAKGWLAQRERERERKEREREMLA